MVITMIERMVSDSQTNITIPLGIAKRLDRFLNMEIAKEMGLTSRPQTVIMVLRELLDKYVPVETNTQVSEISLIDTYNNKIILKDSEKGTILVEIDKNFKLQCYEYKEDPHDNRYVRYCLKNKELWPFLKSKNVKLVKPRTIDKDNTD